MSSFKQQDLFASGPHQFVVGGLTERHELGEQPGADGAAVTPLGRSARFIEQTGTLIADDPAGLGRQISAIEQAMDGQAGDLVDHLGRWHSGVLMVEFQPGDVRRVGLRVAVAYHVKYVQPQPVSA